MKLRVIGAKKKTRLIREATIYFVDNLIPKRKQKNLDIRIEITRKFKQFQMGEMEHVGKNKFLIRSFPFANDWLLLRTIAHEIVHVMQYKEGMKDYDNGYVTYNGSLYNEHMIDYYEYPWEIEAMGRERGLTINFLKSKDMYTWDLMKRKESVYLLL